MVARLRESGGCGVVEAPWAGPRIFPQWGGDTWNGDGPQGSEFEEKMRKVQVRGRIKKGESRSPRKRMAPSVT